MICSSEKRLFFMGASPLVLYREKLTYGWTSFRGAGHWPIVKVAASQGGSRSFRVNPTELGGNPPILGGN
jgi:hypothetical protein